MKDQFLNIKLNLPANDNTFGFHLIRTLWDPYPRVEKVEEDSIAFDSGVKTGDFIIEINQKSLLGHNIQSILEIVKDSKSILNLHIWRPELEHPSFNMIHSILMLLACPVCANSIAKLPRQCRNGHLICSPCIVRSINCPICRAPLGKPLNDIKALPGARCLIAEQLTSVLQTAGYVVPTSHLKKSSKKRLENDDEETECTEENKQNKTSGKLSFTTRFTELWKGNNTHQRRS